MATMQEKIVDMLSTIREIRQNIRKKSKVKLFQLADQIRSLFDKNLEMRQQELFEKFPEISPRTMRRHIHKLMNSSFLIATRHGKKVVYKKNEHLSTK